MTFLNRILSDRFYFTSIVTLILLGLFFTFRWNGEGGKHKHGVIFGDGKGYYSYLPATFIDHNLGDLPQLPTYTKTVAGKQVIKYYAGTAMCMSPFFFLGHLAALSFGFEADGWSLPYQMAIGIGALFYLVFGIWQLQLFLSHFNKEQRINNLAVFALVFGSNLLYYSVFSSSWSHVYSFALITCLLNTYVSLSDNFDRKKVYILALVLGLIVIVRPVNVLVVLCLPLLSKKVSDFRNILSRVLSDPLLVLGSVLLGIWPLLIQMLAWKSQSGLWFVWSYAGEGFVFSNPRFFDFLISFRKGWFIYTPVAFLGIAGLLWSVQSLKSKLALWLSFWLLLIYLASSWWNWYYGDSPGQRVFIEYYALIALGITFLLNAFTQIKWKRTVAIGVLFMVLFTLAQTFQYYMDIIHPANMTAEAYRATFLRFGDSYRHSIGGNKDIRPLDISADPFYEFDSEKGTINDWSNIEGSNKESLDCFESKNPFYSTSNSEWGPHIQFDLTKQNKELGKVYIEMDAFIGETHARTLDELLLVVDVRDKRDEHILYQAYKVRHLKKQPCSVQQEQISIALPEIPLHNNTLHLYFWNRNKEKYQINRLSLILSGN